MYDTIQKPIFFIGAPRSGTTIISEIILQHPDLAWPSNYQEAVPRYPLINFLRRFFDNSLWQVIGNKKQLHEASKLNYIYFKPGECYKMWDYLTGDQTDFSRGFLLDNKPDEDRKNFIRNYFSKMVFWQGRKRLALKITGPPKIGYLKAHFPDAKFVLIRRNLIPTISSLLKVDFWKNLGLKQLWWTGPYTEEEKAWAVQNSKNPELLAAFQLKKIRWAEKREIEKCQPDLLVVNYENFVDHPNKQIKDILDHCNLSYHSRIEKYLSRNPVVSRNKKDTEYFSPDMLKQIYKILATE